MENLAILSEKNQEKLIFQPNFVPSLISLLNFWSGLLLFNFFSFVLSFSFFLIVTQKLPEFQDNDQVFEDFDQAHNFICGTFRLMINLTNLQKNSIQVFSDEENFFETCNFFLNKNSHFSFKKI